MNKPTHLTIEHLSAYLPFGVKAISVRTGEARTVTVQHFTYNRETVGINHLLYDGLLIDRHKLILRPLSQLTVPITHNGEVFEPMQPLVEQMGYEFLCSRQYESLILGYADRLESPVIEIDLGAWLDTPYWIIKHLHSLHFDTFGLIESGLAIAMNPDGTIAK